jgi:glucosamine kinase
MSRVLGIDIGGSTSRARLAADGELLAEVQAPSASLTAAGLAAARQALASLLAQLPGTGPASLDAVCAGAAGMSEPDTREFLLALLRPLTKGGLVSVVPDMALVLPAAGFDDGIAVISGTGSVAIGQWQQHQVRAGGWGYLLGDEGSGYWIARAAVRAVLARRDRGQPGGPLAGQLTEAAGLAGIDELHAAFLRQPEPARWARYAPVALNSDDPLARALTTRAAAALAGLAATTARRLRTAYGAPPGLPVVLAGGLMKHELFRQAVTGAVAGRLPGSDVVTLTEPPVAGAVRLAYRQALRAAAGAAP